MISQFNIIIATIIILMPFTQQLHKNNDKSYDDCDGDGDGNDDSDSVAKKATKKAARQLTGCGIQNTEQYVRQIDAITVSTHPQFVCALYSGNLTPPTSRLSFSHTDARSRRMRWPSPEPAATSMLAAAASWRLDVDDDGVDYSSSDGSTNVNL